MTDIAFHPEARAEFDAAAIYYEAQRTGLGHDYVAAVERALAQICDFPASGPVYGKTHCRRLGAPRFPYGIIYRITDAGIWIVAVAHAKRRPGYWRKRLPGPTRSG